MLPDVTCATLIMRARGSEAGKTEGIKRETCFCAPTALQVVSSATSKCHGAGKGTRGEHREGERA